MRLWLSTVLSDSQRQKNKRWPPLLPRLPWCTVSSQISCCHWCTCEKIFPLLLSLRSLWSPESPVVFWVTALLCCFHLSSLAGWAEVQLKIQLFCFILYLFCTFSEGVNPEIFTTPHKKENIILLKKISACEDMSYALMNRGQFITMKPRTFFTHGI